ncbi:MAG: DUF2117 domain-containing protein, partial [Methanoregulaceae archaeon]|nr:DUF2117 domain-containing protein [Methanoregulaceae archaeon]
VLRSEEGNLVPVSGMVPKIHGLEKISGTRYDNLSRVWCKSGHIRSRGPAQSGRRGSTGRVLFIDHCGHQIYHNLTPDVCGIVCVGDDTTAVCGHICSHLGIPVFGIVDGDSDGIVSGSFVRGSVIAMAVSERDDDIGAEIRDRIPHEMVSWDDMVRMLMEYLRQRVRFSTPGG